MRILSICFFLLVFSLSGNAQSIQETILTASGDGFWYGHAVSISGDYIVIGDPIDAAQGSSGGAAYIIKRQSDGSWNEIAKLLTHDGVSGDLFGFSVDIEGSRAVVGAFGDDDAGQLTGSVYIFEEQPGGTWEQVAKLTASDMDEQEVFGSAVSLEGNRLLVGAPGNGVFSSSPGSAYVFERQANGEWVEREKLIAEDGVDDDSFGSRLSLSGSFALVGANSNDALDYNSGAAYMFKEQADGSWAFHQKLLASDGGDFDHFGQDVSLDGDYAAIGSNILNESPTLSSGRVYFFERQADDSWIETTSIISDDIEINDAFGLRLDLEGDQLLVGSQGNADAGPNTGSAYLFERDDTGTWQQAHKFLASDAQASDDYGYAVSMDGETVVIGARRALTVAGSAYVYDLKEDDVLVPTVTSLTLIDAYEDEPIAGFDPIPDGAVINLNELPTTRLSVRANTAGPVESVLMQVRRRMLTDNVPPYALFDDVDGDYRGRTFNPGIITFSATPYSEDGLAGEEGATVSVTVSFVDAPEGITSEFRGYPNPFNPQTTITFELSRSSDVRLAVYDMLGREVAVLLDGSLSSGTHNTIFDAEGLASGMYYARLVTDVDVQTQKLLLTK